jgi:DNA-binding MurR/RpiR family transcriptional regulator
MKISGKKIRKATAPSGSFVARVRDILNGLSATERRLADFVLDFPGELASYSASELAKLAHVSNATVSRFIRRIGYDSYDDARRHVRSEKRTGSPLFLSAPEPAEQPDVLKAQLQHSHNNLNGTFNRISGQQIDEIARAVVNAEKVWVFGYRSSQSFASYFRWQIVQLVERANLVPGPGETLAENLVNIGERDCVVIFALRRRVSQIARIVAYAANTGAKILYVTDHHFADRIRVDWLIRCDTYAPGPLDNHVAVMALCDLLITKVFEYSGLAGRRRLTAIEAAHDTLDDL